MGPADLFCSKPTAFLAQSAGHPLEFGARQGLLISPGSDQRLQRPRKKTPRSAKADRGAKSRM